MRLSCHLFCACACVLCMCCVGACVVCFPCVCEHVFGLIMLVLLVCFFVCARVCDVCDVLCWRCIVVCVVCACV